MTARIRLALDTDADLAAIADLANAVSYRGRGIARALKLTTIGWAIEHGLDTLDTGNDVDNAAMRALNARLGYRPLPDEVTMRGPVDGGIIEP